MATIRDMTHEEVPNAIALAKLMHHLSPNYREFLFSPERVARFFIRAIDDPDWLCVVAESEKGGIEGAMLAQCYTKFFSEDREAVDMGIFTPFPNRGLGRLLIDHYVKWAKEKGAKQIKIQVEAGMDLEVLATKLQHMGWKSSGFSMVFGGNE